MRVFDGNLNRHFYSRDSFTSVPLKFVDVGGALGTSVFFSEIEGQDLFLSSVALSTCLARGCQPCCVGLQPSPAGISCNEVPLVSAGPPW